MHYRLAHSYYQRVAVCALLLALLPLAVQAQAAQQITITTPRPGTQITSPVVLTGRLIRRPARSQLSYVVRDAASQQLGSGSFGVEAIPGRDPTFTASLDFRVPTGGGPVTITLTDSDPATGAVAAQASITLVTVASPQVEQRIVIDSPLPGAQVASPVAINGRLARLPQGNLLTYRIADTLGNQLGNGTITVRPPAAGAPITFSAELPFTPPVGEAAITIELFEFDAALGTVVARAAINLAVGLRFQGIFLDSPSNGSVVSSPIAVSGRLVRLPSGGALQYVLRDAQGRQIAAGSFAVPDVQFGPLRFRGTIAFEQPAGGALRLELFDRGPSGVLAATAVDLQVKAQIPAPEPQSLYIDTPVPGAYVTSPFVVTGQAARPPLGGVLYYRIRDDSGNEVGAGRFAVTGSSGQPLKFQASLNFRPPVGSSIGLEIFEPHPDGSIAAITAVNLSSASPPAPPPNPPAEIQVQLRPSAQQVSAGQVLSFELVVQNRGRGDAKHVTLRFGYTAAALRLRDVQLDETDTWVSRSEAGEIEIQTNRVRPGAVALITLRFEVLAGVAAGTNVAGRARFSWDNQSKGGGSGTSNEPGVTIAGSSAPPNVARLAVSPGRGPRGTTFTFTSQVYAPKELVALWLNKPDGTVAEVDDTAADRNGAVRFQYTTTGLPPGRYSMVARGSNSELTLVAEFVIE